ncbi:putative dolichyl-P-Glc:Man(9)GlcNAc(2)-PP-dolichol alpha-1,3-glucosyltransferase [Medicago truncatula]|uniref:Alpha-1,3-glucosyltransferase n=1 Tax=Medicago truncatula TaxID=3880 RepID=A0A396HAX3_MEDTR|nr:probable dolichyl pyrophosphate Man9GlcNAc2 alpha-1,3-glucosyltransferase [Medicago truncatula]RHN50439.1 putative dolichyl-P-Glc:Man(9)GlcNAc(2)-PP-dolichol alpha-1,3-glucosyltransferase [Medicago truncatula]
MKNKTKKNTTTTTTYDNANSNNPWSTLINKGTTLTTFTTIALFVFLIRFLVSLYPYSGFNTPPKFGDFEAQRHWMEITINLPVRDWYKNGTFNDLSYWGLDYPPLTAYQSWVHGVFLRFFHPESVELFDSRGHESYLGKQLMRWTVISSDALIFFPAVLYFIIVHYNQTSRSRKTDLALHITMLLLNPCLILIDHGHFQYNCISLGFTVAAVAAILSEKDLVGSVFYCLALNHKQMSAYFAPAFFSHLFGKCLRRKHPLLEVTKLGLVVLGTFAAVWWPYLYSTQSFLEILSRLAPFERGIFEDYVANFWCATSIIIKWKRLFATGPLKLLSFSATIISCFPSMVQQIKSPSNKGFLYALLNCSLAFYLFSFQVHEKSILLPLLPATMLALEEPFIFKWFMKFAMFSMFPLMCRDGLIVPYFALFALFILVLNAPGQHRVKENNYFHNYLGATTIHLILFFSLILHIVYLTMQPPKKYPFIFEAIIMNLCFSQFVIVTLGCNVKQWMLNKPVKLDEIEKKLI